jgi:hypothetical protein
MVRGLILAGAFALGSGALCQADESPPPRPVAAAPSGAADTPDLLEAQLDTRKAYSRAAEVALAAAKKKLDRAERARVAGTATAEDVDQAKTEVETAAAQLDIRKAEVRETEVRLKLARKRPDGAKPAAAPTVAVFNMAAVMREYEKAKYQVYQLNQKRLAESFDLVKWRSEYIQLKADVDKTTDPQRKEDLGQRMVELARKIEDKDRAINKMLNDEASAIISQLYDEIKAVVDKIGEENKYQIVFAYPDAVTPEEHKNPQLKELKLKPPAAQPFFVSKPVDITAAMIRKLNASYPPLDEKGQKVDVSKLIPATPSSPLLQRN